MSNQMNKLQAAIFIAMEKSVLIAKHVLGNNTQ